MKVSVLCEVYNQATYIRSCLNGIVLQKTDFPFEVLVHDDASTDGTADIIREYERNYPGIIVGIYEKENQYSKGINIDMEYLFPRAKGEYLAFCEGDDYWIDENKLQKQVDALDVHPELDICAHASFVEENGKYTEKVIRLPEDGIISSNDVISGGGGFVSTASLMFRARINETIPEFRRFYHNDYSIQIHGALRGGMCYLKDAMCVYRCLARGSWSSGQFRNTEKKTQHSEDTIQMLEILNRETDGKYSDTIADTILRQKYSILKAKEMFKELTEEPYRRIFLSQSLSERLKIIIKRDIPILWKIRKGFIKE